MISLSMVKKLDSILKPQNKSISPNFSLLDQLMSVLPFEYYCLFLHLPKPYDDFDHQYALNVLDYKLQENELVTNYRHDWLENYFESELQFQDPVLTTGRVSPAPFMWGNHNSFLNSKQTKISILQNKDLTQLIKKSSNYGITSGISIPLSYGSINIGILTVSSPTTQTPFSTLELIALCSHLKMIGDYFAFYKKGMFERPLSLDDEQRNLNHYHHIINQNSFIADLFSSKLH